MKECECGSKNFNKITTVRIDIKVGEDEILKVINRKDLGSDSSFYCIECGKKYYPSDFKDVIY